MNICRSKFLIKLEQRIRNDTPDIVKRAENIIAQRQTIQQDNNQDKSSLFRLKFNYPQKFSNRDIRNKIFKFNFLMQWQKKYFAFPQKQDNIVFIDNTLFSVNSEEMIELSSLKKVYISLKNLGLNPDVKLGILIDGLRKVGVIYIEV